MPSVKWLLLLLPLCLSACSTSGPVGSRGFDPGFGAVVEAGERVLLYSACEVRVGTYMEEEIKLVPSYDGVLLLTDQGLRFLQWDDAVKGYEVQVQFPYGALAEHKLQLNTLIPSYVAVRTADGYAYAFLLPDAVAAKAEQILSNARH